MFGHTHRIKMPVTVIYGVNLRCLLNQIQETVMEADYDDFTIVDKYINSIPRPNEDESKALNTKLIQRGQQVPIEVRRKDMGILDGYTRHELLGQRGVKIKYIFKHFETEEDELVYVVETNVMRRQLNSFQRVEVMYSFYIQTKLDRRLLNREAHFDIFRALLKGAVTVKDLVGITKYHKATVLGLCKELSDSGFIRKTEEKLKGNGNVMFLFKILPKGESSLVNTKPRVLGESLVMLGEIVGVKENSVRNACNIIKSGDEEIMKKLRRGTLSLSKANNILFGVKKSRKGEIHWNVWGKNAKIKCPSCNHVALKKEYKVVV